MLSCLRSTDLLSNDLESGVVAGELSADLEVKSSSRANDDKSWKFKVLR